MYRNKLRCFGSSLSLLLKLLMFICAVLSCKKDLVNKVTTEQSQMQNSNSPNLSQLPARWPEHEFPLEMRISDDFTEAEKSVITDMFLEWQRDLSLPQPFFTSETIPVPNPEFVQLSDYHDNEMGVYKSSMWFPEISSQVLAITQFFGRRKNSRTPFEYIEMEHADIIVNYKNFSFSTTPGPILGSYDLASVLLHEIGHFLGLPHDTSSNSSIMAPSLSMFHQNRKLFDIDRKKIQDNYQINQLINGQHARIKYHEEGSGGIEGELVHGILELSANGNCDHYINEEKIFSHQMQIKGPNALDFSSFLLKIY